MTILGTKCALIILPFSKNYLLAIVIRNDWLHIRGDYHSERSLWFIIILPVRSLEKLKRIAFVSQHSTSSSTTTAAAA